MQRRRDLGVGVGCALGQCVGDPGSRIPRPPLDRIEGYNSDRIGVLAGPEILQDRLEVGVSLVGLAPGATGTRAEVFKHQINVAVEAVSWLGLNISESILTRADEVIE